MPFFASCSCSISLHLFSLMRDIIIIMRAALVSYYVLKLMYEEFSFFFRRVLALIWNVSRGISGNRDQSSHSGRKAVIINCVNENKKRVRFHLWVPCFCIWHHNLNTVALAQPLQIVRSYILTWMCAFFSLFRLSQHIFLLAPHDFQENYATKYLCESFLATNCFHCHTAETKFAGGVHKSDDGIIFGNA